jgi:hypothetical protein
MSKNEVHFFGEMDLNLSKTQKQIYDKAFHIAECCGYMASSDGNCVTLYGQYDGEVKLYFEEDKFSYLVIAGKKYTMDTIPNFEHSGYGGYFG